MPGSRTCPGPKHEVVDRRRTACSEGQGGEEHVPPSCGTGKGVRQRPSFPGSCRSGHAARPMQPQSRRGDEASGAEREPIATRHPRSQ
eukprot:6830457-Lingulodinium_polyedra.AAC.1